MERLTKNELGKTTGAVMCTYTAEQCNDSCMYGMCKWNKKALLKLKEYEDTGLTPDVCMNYKIFEDELIAKDVTFKHILELIRAEEQGLLVSIDCEGCQHNKLYNHKEWVKSKCSICSRHHYSEYADEFEALKGSVSE